MIELRPIFQGTGGPIYPQDQNGGREDGGAPRFDTADDTPLEIFRRTIPEDSLVNFTVLALATIRASDSVSGATVASATAFRRPGMAAAFSTGNPNISIDDPDAIGFAVAITLDGNDIVMTVTGVAATLLRWFGFEASFAVVNNIAP